MILKNHRQKEEATNEFRSRLHSMSYMTEYYRLEMPTTGQTASQRGLGFEEHKRTGLILHGTS